MLICIAVVVCGQGLPGVAGCSIQFYFIGSGLQSKFKNRCVHHSNKNGGQDDDARDLYNVQAVDHLRTSARGTELWLQPISFYHLQVSSGHMTIM